MPDSKRPRPQKSAGTSFAWKIILIAVALLAASQIIGTLISVSTFETLLLKTMTAKYEILGNDLKRRIEHSLRFGKKLDHFIDMDKLIAPVYQQADDIHEVMVGNEQGRLWFYSQRNLRQQSGIPAPKQQTEELFRVDPSRKIIDLPASCFPGPNTTEPAITLHKNKYHVLLALHSPLDADSGVLVLTFHRSILDMQKNKLMQNAWNKLLLSLIITAMVMGVTIHLLFTVPARRQTGQMARMLGQDVAPRDTMKHPTGNCLQNMASLIADFQANTSQAEEELGAILRELEKLNPDRQFTESVGEMQSILQGEPSETD